MTNKQAINILLSLPLQAPSDSELVDIQLAIRMAVKALEQQERCKDLANVTSPTEVKPVYTITSNTVERSCKNCKWFRNDQDACYADYYTQHRCVNHSEFKEKKNDIR